MAPRNSNWSGRLRWISFCRSIGLGAVALITAPLFGQDWAVGSRLSLPVDWSFSHVTFTQRFSPAQAARMQNDPRLYYSWLLQGHLPAANPATSVNPTAKSKKPPKPQRDWSFSLGSGGVAQNMSPAKFTFDINATADCTNDFAVYGLNVAGTGSQANLVALNNLYSGTSPAGLCGSAPTVSWAYNVTSLSGGKVTTSPSLSLSGTKVVFVESNGSSSVLHVLQWKAGEGSVSSPATPANIINISNGNTVTSGSCLSTSISCDFRLTYNTSKGTTNSSPFYDYNSNHDTLYVGDDNGQLYKISPVFNGTPQLSDSNGFSTACTGSAHGCVVVAGTGVIMTGPVLDFNSPFNIFVGASDGNLYAVLSTAAGTKSNLPIGSGSANGGGIVDAPTIDGSSQNVYAYSAANVLNPPGQTQAINTQALVVQANTTAPLGGAVTAFLGQGTKTASLFNVHSGAFDDKYYNGGGLGHLMMCGTASTTTAPILYAVPFLGSLASVSLTSPGSYTTLPTVSVNNSGTGGNGTLTAAVTATVTSVSGITHSGSSGRGSCGASKTNATSLLQGGAFTTAATVTYSTNSSSQLTAISVAAGNGGTYSAGPITGIAACTTQPTGLSNVDFGVTAANVATVGSGYYVPPAVTFSGGTGTAATATAILTSGTGMATGTAWQVANNQLPISATTALECSPITEIKNGSTDFVFFGFGNASNGAIASDVVTNAGVSALPALTTVTEPSALGGTSGIVIDNVSGSAQASSIYFGTLATQTFSVPKTVNILSATEPGCGFCTANATITTQTPHGFSNGESITIAGVTCSGSACLWDFNGTYTISSVTSTTFQYAFCFFCLSETADGSTGTATGLVPSAAFGAIKLTQSTLQ